jgi:cytochrome c peroxidase
VASLRRWRAIVLLSATAVVLGAVALPGVLRARTVDTRSALAQLGDAIFHDPALSSSGGISCATCHDAKHAFAGADGRAVPMGGPHVETPGLRNAPSLKYLAYNPAFSFAADGTPSGGMDRDGRAANFAEQARGPLLTAFEMGNSSAQDVVDKMRHAPYVREFKVLFGDRVLDDADAALARATLALQQYQREDTATFAPFSSKYDRYLEERTQLSERELQGLSLFEDPAKGNCAACHPSRPSADGTPPLFTDFSYDAVGVPRNPDIPANADRAYHDLGLCGSLRTDLSQRRDLCGAFKVPTLRNVALTAPYFHNGRFQTLRDVVAFYARRDTHPEEWYPVGADGVAQKYDDLPADYAANVNESEAPYDRHPGEAPALSWREIDEVVAFLQTLTDGYSP